MMAQQATKRQRQVQQVIGAIGMGGPGAARRADGVRQQERAQRGDYLRKAIAHDGPTPELRQHHDVVEELVKAGDQREAVVKRVITQWPLDRYKVRSEITPLQWRAGDRLRNTFERTGVEARVCGRYEPDVVQNSAKAWDVITDGQDAARSSLRKAFLAVGPELSGVLMHVCCNGGLASDWAAARFGQRGRSAQMSGSTTLRLALDALVRHFGMSTCPQQDGGTV